MNGDDIVKSHPRSLFVAYMYHMSVKTPVMASFISAILQVMSQSLSAGGRKAFVGRQDTWHQLAFSQMS